MEFKVKTKLEQIAYNLEFKAKYKQAQKLNRHDRRALGIINKIGMIHKKR
jgi:hypothetical protein